MGGEEVFFPPYSADELRAIIADRIDRAFIADGVSETAFDRLALHPEGPPVFEVVADVIDDQREIEFAELYPNARLGEEEEEGEDGTAEPDQRAPDDDHQVTLKNLAETRYELLASVWKDAIAEIP